MTKQLVSIEEAAQRIQNGQILLIAGDEALLETLPKGQWIGGTSANFMTSDGGISTKDQLYITDLSANTKGIKIKTYTQESLKNISLDYPENGFSIIIIPAFSAIHEQFSIETQEYEGIFNTPLMGWISGIHIDDLGKKSPKVFAGSNQSLSNEAVVMHVELHDDLLANINIINLFKQGESVDIEFLEEGFSCKDCLIDGSVKNLADYIRENNIDIRLPFVANYSGAMINVSVQSVDDENGIVHFYAPIFRGITYKVANKVEDYIHEFETILETEQITNVLYSCNCISNFLYADLTGKKTGNIVGPITFGEIAYILLNQTLVYLTIEKHS